MKTITFDETKWKLVPVNPTSAMANAWFKEAQNAMSTNSDRYRAMLHAAPQAPAAAPEDHGKGVPFGACDKRVADRLKAVFLSIEDEHGAVAKP